MQKQEGTLRNIKVLEEAREKLVDFFLMIIL